MAKQNSAITIQGKLGNIVGYKGRDGKKLARLRQTEVYNPKTTGQVFQRLIIATAARAYSMMQTICDHSFQNVSVGAKSQSYFLKRATKDLRDYIAKNYPEMGSPTMITVKGLSSPTANNGAGVGLLISEGTLPVIRTTLLNEYIGYGNVMSIGKDEEMTIGDVMSCLNALPGDQISILTLTKEFGLSKTRYVINPELTDEQRKTKWNLAKNDAQIIVEKEVSNEATITYDDSGLITVTAENGNKYGSAIILSRKNGNSWYRSTQQMNFEGDVTEFLEENNPARILAEWKAGSAQIDSTNPLFLNQAKEGE